MSRSASKSISYTIRTSPFILLYSYAIRFPPTVSWTMNRCIIANSRKRLHFLSNQCPITQNKVQLRKESNPGHVVASQYFTSLPSSQIMPCLAFLCLPMIYYAVQEIEQNESEVLLKLQLRLGYLTTK